MFSLDTLPNVYFLVLTGSYSYDFHTSKNNIYHQREYSTAPWGHIGLIGNSFSRFHVAFSNVKKTLSNDATETNAKKVRNKNKEMLICVQKNMYFLDMRMCMIRILQCRRIFYLEPIFVEFILLLSTCAAD